MPTVEETIQIGQVSGYLMSNDIAKKAAFQRGSLADIKGHILVWRATKIIKTIFDIDPDYEGLQYRADYLYWLCGKYAQKAQAILDLGLGGGVAGISPELVNSIQWIYEEIEVGAVGSPLDAGDTSYTLNYTNIIPNSVTVELPQSNVPQGETNQFSYNPPIYSPTNVVINFTNDDGLGNNLGVQNGMLLIIKGARLTPSTSGTTPSQPKEITVYGNEIVGNSWSNPAYAGYDLSIVHNGVKTLTSGVHFDVDADGGFTFIGTYAGITWTVDDEFITKTNGLLVP